MDALAERSAGTVAIEFTLLAANAFDVLTRHAGRTATTHVARRVGCVWTSVASERVVLAEVALGTANISAGASFGAA